MKYLLLALLFISGSINPADAFSNSLDSNPEPQQSQGYNSLSKQQQNSNQNNTFTPKTHDSLNHQKQQFPDSSNNPSRYNTNCQFGICIPGGINPNSR